MYKLGEGVNVCIPTAVMKLCNMQHVRCRVHLMQLNLPFSLMDRV